MGIAVINVNYASAWYIIFVAIVVPHLILAVLTMQGKYSCMELNLIIVVMQHVYIHVYVSLESFIKTLTFLATNHKFTRIYIKR